MAETSTDTTTSGEVTAVGGEYLTSDTLPGMVRAVGGEYLRVTKTPAELRKFTGQFLETAHPSGQTRKVGGEFLRVTKTPAQLRSASGYFLESANPPGSTRKIGGEFLRVTKSPAQLRSARAYYVETVDPSGYFRGMGGEIVRRPMAMPKFLVGGRQELLDRINEENSTTFTFADLTFDLPIPVDHHTFNTRVRVHAKPGSGFSRHVDVLYYRVPLIKALKWDSDTSPFDLTGVDTTHDLLAQIQALTGYLITEEDILDEPVTTPDTVAFTANPNSYYFLPNTGYTYGRKLEDEIVYRDLQGFVHPEIPLAELLQTTDLSHFGAHDDIPLSDVIIHDDLVGFKKQEPIDLKTLFGQ